MLSNISNSEEINILASATDWPWPIALENIFRPRGVNLMVAERANEFIDIIANKRIHVAIIDLDSEITGLAVVRIIRMDYPRLPFLLLKQQPDENLLAKALSLDVFSVLNKPVNMRILQTQLNRLFISRYNSEIFAER